MLKNGDLKIFDKKETPKRFSMNVHFNQNSMATILSFKEVADIPGVRITMDINQERAMMVTLKIKSFSSSRSTNLATIFTTQKGKITRQKQTTILIKIPLFIILVFRKSRKIKTY